MAGADLAARLASVLLALAGAEQSNLVARGLARRLQDPALKMIYTLSGGGHFGVARCCTVEPRCGHVDWELAFVLEQPCPWSVHLKKSRGAAAEDWVFCSHPVLFCVGAGR